MKYCIHNRHKCVPKTPDSQIGWDYGLYLTEFFYPRFFSVDTTPSGISFDTPILDTGWYHLVVRRSGSTVTLFRNGQADGGGTMSGPFPVNTYPLRIGKSGDQFLGDTWGGSIDDVRLYDRALSQSEISQLYRLGEGSKQAVTQTHQPTLKDGLVGHWTFDGSNMEWNNAGVEVRDISGRGNHGDLDGIDSSHARIGPLGQSFLMATSYVNSITPNIRIPYNTDFDFETSQAMTASIWVHPFDENGGDSERVFDAYRIGPGWEIAESFGTYGVKFEDQTSTEQEVSFNVGGSSDPRNTRQWVHLLFTYDGDVFRMYHNGTLTNTSGSFPNAKLYNTDDDYRIGNRMTGNFAPFVGMIDDVRLYDRTLSADEVLQLYRLGEGTKINTTITPPSLETDLVGHWTFDGPDMEWQTAGAEVLDRSGQGNHGAINGSLTNRSGVEGVLGQGMQFNGVDDGIHLGGDDALGPTGDFSVMAWFKLDSVPASGEYVNAVYTAGGTDGEYWVMYVNDNIAFQEDAVKGSAANTILATSTWYHGAVVKDGDVGNNITFYLNGEFDGTDSHGNVLSNGDKTIGYRCEGSCLSTFDGVLDNIRLYRRALSPDEIKQLYRLGARE